MSDELTPEEQEVEDNVERAEPADEETRKQVQRILSRARKNQAISLRLPKEDVELTKKRAAEAGLPYQTLISSIIHKYVTDQLYERDEVFIIHIARLEHRPVNAVIDQVVDRVLKGPWRDLARKRHRQHRRLLIRVLTKPRHLPLPDARFPILPFQRRSWYFFYRLVMQTISKCVSLAIFCDRGPGGPNYGHGIL